MDPIHSRSLPSPCAERYGETQVFLPPILYIHAMTKVTTTKPEHSDHGHYQVHDLTQISEANG